MSQAIPVHQSSSDVDPIPRGPMSPPRHSASPDDDPDAFHESISRGLGQRRESTDIRTFTILGLPIAAVTFDQALQLLLTAPAAGRRVSVHFCTTHTLVEATAN